MDESNTPSKTSLQDAIGKMHIEEAIATKQEINKLKAAQANGQKSAYSPEGNPTTGSPSLETGVQNSANPLSQKSIRTYERDVAEIMARRKTSVASMVLAEKNKQDTETKNSDGTENQTFTGTNTKEERTQTKKKLLITLVSLVIIGIGIVGGYYLYNMSVFSAKTPVIVKTTTNTSIIPIDSIVTLSIDNMISDQILTKIKTEIAKPQAKNTIKEITLTETKNDQVTRVTSQNILKKMKISPPDSLLRSLDNDWMLGVYANDIGQKDVFVIVTNNFFQNAFAGMIEWENVMADDLKQFVNNVTIDTDTDEINAIGASTTTSASTTPSMKSYGFTLRGHFTDGIVKNKDVREFQSDQNKTIFLYSFIDNTKLVITSKEETLTEIISRLEKQLLIR